MIPPCRNAGAWYLKVSSIRSSDITTAGTAAIMSRFGFRVVASHSSTSAVRDLILEILEILEILDDDADLDGRDTP